MDNNHNAIRFVDRDGKELFKIPDGASIRVVYPPGDGRGIVTLPCEYIGEHHAKIGKNVYHIDQGHQSQLFVEHLKLFHYCNFEATSLVPRPI
jgi:hypothetical protein